MPESDRLGPWLHACQEAGRVLVDAQADGGGFDGIAGFAREASGADLALLLRPVGDEDHRVIGADGVGAAAMRGTLLDPWAWRPGPSSSSELPSGLARGRRLVVGFGQDKGRERLLVLLRSRDAPDFTSLDHQLAPLLGAQLEQAMGRGDISRLHEQLAVLAERDRIARDLHDIVIQRIFAAGLGIRALSRSLPDAADRGRADDIVGELDTTIADLRETVYALRGQGGDGEPLSTSILRAVRTGSASLSFTPRLHLSGPLDQIHEARTTASLLAVVSEALSNAVRHARAGRISVSVSASASQLRLRVNDNGQGFSRPVDGNGLANMSQRARELGGTCTVDSNWRGTRVRWSVPIR